MSGSNSNATILLKRVLSLNEFSPLILCIDSIAQTANYVLEEILYNASKNGQISVIYVSFESVNCPSYAAKFIDVESVGFSRLSQAISSYLPSSPPATSSPKHIVIVDSMNHIPKNQVAQLMASISSKNVTVLGVYHRDIPEISDPTLEHYPSVLSLLYFMATTVLEVNPILSNDLDEEELKDELVKYLIPRGLNNSKFQLTLTSRRKSGRSLIHNFYVDSNTHNYEVVREIKDDDQDEDENPEALQDLTTFNLSTSTKQKIAKDQVALPFLEAQSFNTGGAIVYQFEKDDDYDEEDPYEDPF